MTSSSFNYQMNTSNQLNTNYEMINKELEKRLKDEIEKNQRLIYINLGLVAKINKLNLELDKKNEETKQIYTQIKELKEVLNNKVLKQKSNNYQITDLKPGENILAVNFVSMGTQDIGHFNLICKNTDLFIKLEERLYKEFPQFKNYDTYFQVNTRKIKRFKTLDENGIKNNDIINIFVISENNY